MSESRDNIAQLMGTKRLADAVRQAKIAAAHRSDVVVDIREADRARLEILAEELHPIIRELDPADDYFDFTISGGSHPRLRIDGTASVMMARDRRTYRFVRETRIGRLTMAESTEPRTIADRVTERFFRADPSRTRHRGGSGLGLAIVKHLVEAMDGSVGVDPVEPRGSAFWFALPTSS